MPRSPAIATDAAARRRVLSGRWVIHAGKLREDLRIGNRALRPIVQDEGSSSCTARASDGDDGEHVGWVRRPLEPSDRLRIDTARGRVCSARKTMHDAGFACCELPDEAISFEISEHFAQGFAPRLGRNRRVRPHAPGTQALRCTNPTRTVQVLAAPPFSSVWRRFGDGADEVSDLCVRHRAVRCSAWLTMPTSV